jgi:hypothetical protein
MGRVDAGPKLASPARNWGVHSDENSYGSVLDYDIMEFAKSALTFRGCILLLCRRLEVFFFPNIKEEAICSSKNFRLVNPVWISLPIGPRFHSRSQETTTPSSVVWVGKICFSCIGTIRSIATLQW